MKNKTLLLNKIAVVSSVLLCSFTGTAQQAKADIKPNIIIFYADDLGWQDTQLNDLDEPTPWETPNLVSLAKEGMNFTNAYSPAPTCAPSRCAMITGLHPTKTGVTHVDGGKMPEQERNSAFIAPFYPTGLTPEHFTMAEALKTNGYKTGHVGKWHMGNFEEQSSVNQGFDFAFESRGAHQGPKGDADRASDFATDNPKDPYHLSTEKYAPFTKTSPKGISYPYDEVTEKALQFLDKNKKEPFFLYLAHWLVHAPIHTKNKELLQYYSDKLGVPFPTKDIPVTTPGQTNPYYGSMVTTLDWSLGRIVDYLKKTDDPRNPGKKLFETTYIIFSSDNGGCEKANGDIVTDNFPLDEGKKYAQEGGIRVPTVIAGPGVAKGSNFDGLFNQLDLFPTFLDLTHTKIDAKYSSNLDGLDITGVLLKNEKNILDKSGKPREDLWWHFPNNTDKQMQSAIRSGDYKLYKNLTTGTYELYRLYKDGKRADLEEKHDIAKQEVAVTKALATKLEKYLKENNAQFPYLNPAEKKVDYAGKEKAVNAPKIISDVYDAKTQKAVVTLEKGKSKVIEGYALIEIADGNKKGKHGTTYIKVPVQASADGLSFTLNVPERAKKFIFMLVDENRFLVKSKETKKI